MGCPSGETHELCLDAFFVKGNLRRYRAVRLIIKEIPHSFLPDVEIASLNDFYLDITHIQCRSLSTTNTAAAIQKKILDKTRLTVSIGVASSNLIARIASGLNKPAGLTIVPHGNEKVFLRDLPVRLLRGIGAP